MVISTPLSDWCQEHNVQLLKEWNYDRNNGLAPSDVSYGTNRKVWWVCECGHEWQASVYSRVSGNNCPYCSGRMVLKGFNDLEHLAPSLAKQWHPTKNGSLLPSQVTLHSSKKIWWLCSRNHEWQDTIDHRSTGLGCPYCSGKRVLTGFNDLQITNPDLAKQWHPSRNGLLKPTDVNRGSHKKIWWMCKSGHEWLATVNSRTSSKNGCPYCSGKAVLKGFNDLGTTNKKLAAQWHPTKNGDKQPSDFTEHSNKSVWWICDSGHEWKAVINNRSYGTSCPYCDGIHVLSGFNDLATINPQLAKQWHPTKNGDLKPSDIRVSSGQRVWWRCEFGHEWEASINNRNQGHGCPICQSGQRVSFGEKALVFYLSKYIAIEENYKISKSGLELDIFIPSLNIGIEYDGAHFHQDVSRDLVKNGICETVGIRLIRVREFGCPPISNCIVFSVDPVDTISMNATIHNVLESIIGSSDSYDIDISRDSGAILSLKLTSYKEGTLLNMFPEIYSEIHPTRNGNLNSVSLSAFSQTKLWWLDKCGHEWLAPVSYRSAGSGCPYCQGKATLAGFNDLGTVNPDLAKEWHPTKNGDLKPTDVRPGSSKKVWWLGKCGHEWRAAVVDRNAGSGCPYCKYVKGGKDIASQRPDLVPYWDVDSNVLSPSEVTLHSCRKFYWKCPSGHKWQDTPNNMSKKKVPCSFCNGTSKPFSKLLQ